MRVSQLFGKTRRTDPSDEFGRSAKLLVRAGFVHKNMAGVYSLLPLGLRVAKKIETIIRQEIEAISAQELFLNVLQDKTVWQASGRWRELKEVMYQFEDHRGLEIGLGLTHEEVIATIARDHISSYKDLPKAVYQIQTKFRDEPRARSGLLRGREFVMNDLYSFHLTEEDLDSYYEKVGRTYEKIFKRVGLQAIRTEASGGAFSKDFSHEYQVLAEGGEDTVYLCREADFARNREVIFDLRACPNHQTPLESETAIEVGNIFRLGTRFSEAAKLLVDDRDGQKKPLWMGSYGIGIGRLLATIAEVRSDENGLSWPESVAPFALHLISLGENERAEKVYQTLFESGLEPLFDDREAVSPGEKLAEADLLGLPWRAVISQKTGQRIELKSRTAQRAELLDLSALKEKISL